MFFIFSKILLIFILPLFWIIAFLIVAVVTKNPKRKKRFLLISFALLLIFTNPFLFNNFARSWDIEKVPPRKAIPYSCVIVLGGFSSERFDKTGAFNGSADRFIQGVKLLSTHQATHILISGGNGNLMPDNFTESSWVKTQLQALNVPDSIILIEPKSRNTIENAAYSKVLLQNNKLPPPYLLVTSGFHMRRSLGIFKNAGIDVVPYPCNFMTGSGHFDLGEFIPDADILSKWNYYTKEMVGLAVNAIKFSK